MANGLFKQYGLEVDQDQILRDQRQKMQANALGLVQNISPYAADQTAANIGALLGARMARPDGLTEDQMRKAKTASEAEARMKQWLAQNDKASQRQRTKQYKTFLSESAFHNGLPDLGAQISAELDLEDQAQERRDLELDKLGYEKAERDFMRPHLSDITQAERDIAVERGFEAKTGRSKDLYLPGSDKPQTGVIDPTDLSAYINGQKYPLGQYARTPYYADRYAKGGKGGKYDNDGVGVYERSQIRAAYRNQTGLIRQANSMYDLLDQIKTERGSIEEMGAAGGILNYANRLGDNATAIGRALADAAGIDFGKGTLEVINEDGSTKAVDLSSAQGRRFASERYAGQIDQYIVNSGIATRGQNAAALRAKFIELAHAYLKVEEPGGRYTENDMERAMQVVGGDLTQPDALIERWEGKLSRGMEELEDYKSQYDPEIWTRIITPMGEDRVAGEYSRWQERSARRLGRASGSAPAEGDVVQGVAPDAEGWVEIAPGVRIRQKGE